ncbi:MAG: GNAT family N-acetyltransferase [Ferruginibacter sp.]
MTNENINWQPHSLEDDIVKLVPLTESDFDNLFKVAADPLIWEQHPTSDRYKRDVFQLFFDGAVSSKTAFLIADKKSGQVIGSTRYYDYRPENSSIAIGFTFLAKQYWGGLYNRSSKKLLLDYAFQFVDKVFFHIGPTNIRSQLATLKIGATKVNEVVLGHSGQSILHYEYLIQKHEWIS